MRRHRDKGATKLWDRSSSRHPTHDYRGIASYHIVISTHENEGLFGEIIDDGMFLNDLGRIVEEEWAALHERYLYLLPGPRQVMPTHFHGLPEYDPRLCPPHIMELLPLPRLIGALEYHSTRRINEIRGTPGARVWHRHFRDTIIRDTRHYRWAKRYIGENPRRWWEKERNRTARVIALQGGRPAPLPVLYRDTTTWAGRSTVPSSRDSP